MSVFDRFKKPDGPIDAIVAGLGNPGEKYKFTRHNAGFMALDYISQKAGFEIDRVKFKSLVGTAELGGRKVLFMKPQTMMNNSGEAVGEAARFYKIPAERIFVIFDDISLDIGKLRIRRKGSDGGHNGIKSIASHLGSSDFPRIKVGVGNKPHPDYDLADWVLGNIPKEDQKTFFEVLIKVNDALDMVLGGDFEKAMGKFN